MASLIFVLGVIAFFLFGLVFRYHILCILVIQYNTNNQLYLTTLKQLFIDIYVLELCLTNLFIIVCNSNNDIANISQIVLITLVAIATIIFYLTLKNLFASILRHLFVFKDTNCYNVDKKSLIVERSSCVLSRSLQLYNRIIAFCSLSSVSSSLRASIYKFARSQSQIQSRRVYNAIFVLYSISIISISKDFLRLKNKKIQQAKKRLKDLQFSTRFVKLNINEYLIISKSVEFLDKN